MSKIEKYDELRRKILTSALVGYTGFALGSIAREVAVANRLAANIVMLLFAIGFIGVMWFGYQMLKLAQWSNQVKSDPLLKEAMADELHQANETQAFKTSFWVMLGFQALLIVLNVLGMEASMGLTAQMTIFVGVISAIAGYLYLGRETDE